MEKGPRPCAPGAVAQHAAGAQQEEQRRAGARLSAGGPRPGLPDVMIILRSAPDSQHDTSAKHYDGAILCTEFYKSQTGPTGAERRHKDGPPVPSVMALHIGNQDCCSPVPCFCRVHSRVRRSLRGMASDLPATDVIIAILMSACMMCILSLVRMSPFILASYVLVCVGQQRVLNSPKWPTESPHQPTALEVASVQK